MASSIQLRSPLHDRAAIVLPAEASDPHKMMNGSVCSKYGDEYEVRNNVVDMLGKTPDGISMAQWSNTWSLTASVYEDTWRKNSLGLLTGEDFPIEEEQRLLMQWLKPAPDELILDVGCSTGLYARTVANAEPGAAVVGLDFADTMLAEARRRVSEEGLRVFLVRADASDMPFFAGTFDAMVCGGSLNEFADPRKVLYEMRRVIKAGGRVFMMHLLTASSWYGRILQQPTSWGGLHFWTKEESNRLFEQCGFGVEQQVVRGVVCFSLLKAV